MKNSAVSINTHLRYPFQQHNLHSCTMYICYWNRHFNWCYLFWHYEKAVQKKTTFLLWGFRT